MAWRDKCVAIAAASTLGFGAWGSACASDFSPEVRKLAQKYARAAGQCDLHASNSAVGTEACTSKPKYDKALRAKGWEPQDARRVLFSGCDSLSAAYQQAAIERDSRQSPEAAFKQVRQDKSIKMAEPGLKMVVNAVYFEEWATRLAPIQLRAAMSDRCRYGLDPEMKPIE